MAEEVDNGVYARISREVVDYHIIDAIDGPEMAAPITLLIEQVRDGVPFYDFIKVRYVKALIARAIRVAYDKGFTDGLTARAISETEQWETENRDIPEDLQTKRPKSTAEAVMAAINTSWGNTEYSYIRDEGIIGQLDPNIISPR